MNEPVDSPATTFANLVELLRWRAVSDPDCAAYRFLGDGETVSASLSYGELDRRARAIAARIGAVTAPGDRILLALPAGLDYIAGFFACLYAGRVAVPLYPPRRHRHDPRFEAIARDAQASAALTTANVLADPVAEALPRLRWLAVDDPEPALADAWRAPDLAPASLALLQYTSGSTASPKGVMISHANLLYNLADLDRGWEHDRASVMVSWLPLFHDLGLVYGLLQPLYRGFVCYLMQPAAFLQQPVRWLKGISRYGATHSAAPDFAYDLCARTIAPEQRAELDLSRWRMALNAAEPVREETLQRFAEAFAPCGFTMASFCPGYGLAEATLKVTAVRRRALRTLCRVDTEALTGHQVLEVAAPAGRVLVGCGRAEGATRVVIVDPATRLPCPDERIGEIWVAGPTVAQGYWRRPAETTETFGARLADGGVGPFLRSGDLGFLRDGELFITGRLKDVLIIRGLNHYPQDLEQTVEQSHPALRPHAGAAFTVERDGAEHLVIAHEIARPHLRRFAATEVIGAIRRAIAAEHELQAYAVVLLKTGAIPKTSSGKIQRHACRQGFLSGALEVLASSVLEDAPGARARQRLPELAPGQGQTRMESELRELLAALLRVAPRRLRRRQALSRFGLDSLALAQLQQRLAEDWGLDWPLARFLQDSTTLATLAAAALAQPRAAPAPVVVATKPAPASLEWPASYNEQALWLQHQLAPASAAYHLILPFAIRSDLDAAALRQAVYGLVLRHPALRTTYHLRDGYPVQRLHETSAIFLEEVDAAAWTTGELERRLRTAARRPFDLERGPLLRMTLFRRGAGEQRLLLVAHHIVGDMESLLILVEDLGALYAAQQAAAPPLPAPARAYRDYCAWQRDLLAGPAGVALEDYWRRQLGGEPPVLDLPLDHPRPPRRSDRGARHGFRLGQRLTARLKALARTQEVTLYTLLLAAFQVLLYRRTGQPDIVVGSPAAGRRRGFQDVVGCFMNLLALRGDLTGNPSFRALLGKTRAVVLGALEHQDYPFQWLVERLQTARDPARSPLFQVLFTLHQPQRLAQCGPMLLGQAGARLELGGLKLESLALEQGTAQFDLALTLAEADSALLAAFDYRTELFEAASIAALGEQFRALLTAIVADSDCRIDALPLLGAREKRRLTQRGYAPHSAAVACVHDLIAAQSRRTPDATALVCGEQRLSYRQLEARAERLARRLRGLGVGPEMVVAVLAERGVDLPVYLLAVLKAGGAYLPLDPGLPRERLALMLEDTPFVLAERALLPALPDGAARRICPDEEEAEEPRPGFQEAGPDHLAYVIYTSGSTGRPKAVQISHRAVVNLLSAMRRAPGLKRGDRLLAVTTISFDIAVLELFLPLSVGAQVIIASRAEARDPALLGHLIEEHGVSVLQATPATWRMLCAAGWRGHPGLKMLCGGEALPGDLSCALLARGAALWNLYGPTETTVWSCARRVVRGAHQEAGEPLGGPIANTRVYVLDAGLEPAPVGVAGEIYIGGVGLARGYRHDPALTAEKFLPDPFSREAGARMYRTGDLARLRPDGGMIFLGRRDQQIKIRGFRVEPAEIEAVLAQHPQVRASVVVAQADGSGGQRLIAYVASAQPDIPALRGLLQARLPDYMLPAAIVIVPSLPHTPSGKIDRKALPVVSLDIGDPAAPPRTPTERQLAEWWAELLQQPWIGRSSHFFELGGHSLLAVQLATRIRERLAIAAPLAWIFENPTLVALGARLEQAQREAGPATSIAPLPRAAERPLSFAQQRLWFLQELHGPSPAYHMAGTLRLDGPLHVEVMEQSLAALIRRHETLRTRFITVAGRPLQVIADDLPCAWRVVDLSALPEAERAVALTRHELEQAERPFDLARDSPLRATLLRLSAESHRLLLTLHHLVADGWSVGVLVRELGEHYRAGVAGEPPAVTALSIQYADFAHWQRQALAGAALEPQREYWRQRLAGAPPLMELPTDRPRPALEDFRGAREDCRFDAALVQRLEGLGRRSGATLFMVLEAAFAALLARYSGQTDILIGVPVANRDRLEIEPLIGCFINTLVLRNDLSGAPSFTTLVERVRATALAAYAHQELPFEQVVEAVKPERALSHGPLFQVVFNLDAAAPEERYCAGLRFSLEDSAFVAAQYDLTLVLRGGRQGLVGYLEYRGALFDAVTIRRLLGHFHNLLAAVADDPGLRLPDLPLMDAAERAMMLTAWNATASAHRAACSMAALVEEQARRDPAALAVAQRGQQLSYRALNSRANQLARFLRDRRVGSETRLAVCLEPSPEWVIALLGIIKAGGVYVPLDPAFPKARRAAVLTDAAAHWVLTVTQLADAWAETAARLVCLDAEREHLATLDATDLAIPLAPEQLAYLLYTSGSSGTPKGVAISQRALAAHCAEIGRYYRLGPGDRVLQFAAATFDPSLEQILAPLAAGAAVVLRETELWSATEFSAMLAELGVTVVNLPPAYWQRWAQEGGGAALEALRLVIVGGDLMAAQALAEWRNHAPARQRLLNAYGPTEATITALAFEIPAEFADARIPIGRPLANRTAYILDPHGNPVPIGVAGELHLGGAGLARGYWRQPELTAERFIPDPFSAEAGARLYKTGDRARWRADGNIEFLGRVDRQIKLRAVRIEPGEIEAALRQHPAVRAAVVQAHGPTGGAQQLIAYLQCIAPATLDSLGVRQFLAERLPEYLLPAQFVALAEIPLTAHGKIDYAALPAPGAPVRGTSLATTRTPVESILARIAAEILQRPEFGIHDNFFEWGLDSILSLQIVARARQAGVRLTPRQLFQWQSIAELAAVAGSVSTLVAEQKPVTGALPLTPIQRRFFERALPAPHHDNQSVLLEIAADTQAALLQQALGQLLRHHDTLRLRFTPTASGWEQHYGPPDEGLVLLVEDLAAHSPARQRELIETRCAALQASLNLTSGPLLRSAFFRLGDGRPGRLLLIIHHLAVDGVSWRILLEDLAAAYRQLATGASVQLPAKTTSYKTWAEHLARGAQTKTQRVELDHWLNQAAGEPVPVDYPDAAQHNTLDSTAEVTVVVAAEPTGALLRGVCHAYAATPDELLLAALAQTLAAKTGLRALRVEVENHGRESTDEAIDLTRTVGWFTAIFPVAFPVAERFEATLGAVQSSLRAIPNHGAGYGLLRYLDPDPALRARLAAPAAPILFNYLGQFDQALHQPPLLGLAAEKTGPTHAARGQRSHLLEVNALVAGGELSLAWRYSQNLHRHTTVRNWAEGLRAALIALAGQSHADADIEERYPLSPVQEGILFHSRYQPSSQVYLEQLVCAFAGELDPAAIKTAWDRALARHSILRSAIHPQQPLQLVFRDVTLPWQQFDWRELDPAAQAQELEGFLRADRARGFILEQAPLLRGALIQLGEQRWQFVLSHHHLVLDGWSLAILCKEALDGYANADRGQSPYPALARPYRDYIDWLQTQPWSPAERYWRRLLAGFSAPTLVPVLRPADAARAETPAEQSRVLPAALAASLQTLARTHRLTLNTWILGAWALLLGRYSGARDVLFGATIAGRPVEWPDVEQRVGLFINTLPLRVALPDPAALLGWLRGLQDQQAEQQAFAYSALTAIQRCSDLPPGQTLFETIVVVENYPLDGALWAGKAGLRLTSVRTVEQTHYPLALVVTLAPALTLRILYARERIDEDAVAAMLGHLQTLLAGMAAQPMHRLGSFTLLAAAERERILLRWNDTRADYPHGRILPQLFENQARCCAEQTALVCGDEQLSYAELNRRANRLAHYLRRLGVGPEARVGLCVQRSARLAVGLLGILKAGGAYLPLDPSYPPARLAFILADAKAGIVVSETAVRGLVSAATLVCLDDDWPAIAEQSDANPCALATPDNLAYVLYTSGSTGQPKGVAMPHRPLVNLIHWQIQRLPPARTLQFAPLSFDVSFQECFSTWCTGGVLELTGTAQRQDFGLLLAQLASSGVERLYLPVVALQHLAERARVMAEPPPVKHIITAGEQLVVTDAVRALGERWDCRLENQYGPTETHVVTAFPLLGAASDWRSLPPIGAPIANTRVYVLDQHWQPCPAGVPGELYIGGLALARGYLDRPELTAERFLPDPFSPEPGARLYRTGDLARWRTDGILEFGGRADQQVKVRGHRVEPGEVEALLGTHPALRQCAVIARRDQGDVGLAAYVVVAEGAVVSTATLRDFLRAQLPDYLIPGAFMTLDALPLTASGKVDRNALPALSVTNIDYVAPRNPIEEKLAAIWCLLLERERVGVQDDFFALGGHSLAVMRLAARIHEAFGVDLPLPALFKANTIEALAPEVFRCLQAHLEESTSQTATAKK